MSQHTQTTLDAAAAAQHERTYSALFAGLPTVTPGQKIGREHAVVYDAYRRARGMRPWLHDSLDLVLTAVEVNEAITWWNDWQEGRAAA